MKKKIIFIVGPTAVGKTKLSTDIASKINGEIISCDSMQIYKEFNIGTAKINEAEMNNIPHYLIDILDGSEKFNVSQYKTLAENYIEKINLKNKIPILVGGTGLYVDSIIYDLKFTKSNADNEIRKKIETFYNKYGKEVLYDLLLYLDYNLKNKIHINNTKRVIRAVEVCLDTKEKFSEQKNDYNVLNPKYDFLILGLFIDRKILYTRINNRVDDMIKNNLLDEVKILYEKFGEHSQPFTAIGYKEFIPYFKNQLSLEKCIENVKQNSRNYAKRQLTWFNKNNLIKWLNMNDNYNTILNNAFLHIYNFLNTED